MLTLNYIDLNRVNQTPYRSARELTDKPRQNPIDRLQGKLLPDINCAWWDCGQTFTPKAPNQKSCRPEHAALVAEEKVEERKARNRSGGGSLDARKKEAAHAVFLAEEAAKEVAVGLDPDSAAARALAKLKKQRPDLDFGPQHGLPHRKPLRPGDPRIAMATEIADSMPRFSWIRLAELVDGTSKTSSRFQNYHGSCLKGFYEDPAFVEAIDNAMARTDETLNDAAYEEAVIGVERFGVSMGAPVSLGKVRDTKLLSQLLRVTNRDFARANSASGSNLQININNGAATPNPSDDNNPIFHFTYYESLALTDMERDQLAAIASKIISARKKEPVVVDLTPDARTKALMLEARENAEDVEATYDDI